MLSNQGARAGAKGAGRGEAWARSTQPRVRRRSLVLSCVFIDGKRAELLPACDSLASSSLLQRPNRTGTKCLATPRRPFHSALGAAHDVARWDLEIL